MHPIDITLEWIEACHTAEARADRAARWSRRWKAVAKEWREICRTTGDSLSGALDRERDLEQAVAVLVEVIETRSPWGCLLCNRPRIASGQRDWHTPACPMLDPAVRRVLEQGEVTDGR